MERIFYSKMKHSGSRFVLLWLTLVLTFTFLDASVQLFIQSIQSAKIIEENTTTLAIEQIVYEMQEVNGTKQIVPVVYGNEVMKKAKQSAAVIDTNETNTVFATGKGLNTVYPSLSANADGALSQLGAEQIAVFQLRCISAVPEYKDYGGMVTYELAFPVVEALAIHPGSRIPKNIIVRGVSSYVGEPVPFELGKEYVVIGHFIGIEVFRGMSKVGKYIYSDDSDISYPIFEIGVNDFQPGVQQFADCEAIMEADDPRVENLLKIAKQNYGMFMVTGIDQIEGIPLFAMNEAYIVKGREYTREEVKSGARVCLISTAFAEENKLQLGDTIHLNLFKSNYYRRTIDGGTCYVMNASPVIKAPVQQDTFTIIGIYRTKEWGLNKFCFPPATVFVPLKSLTFQGTKGIDYADALILQNGSNEQFLQDMEDAGIRKGVYTIYDGGYMQFMASLKTMQKDAGIVMAVCFLLFLVVTFASLTLMVQHLKKDVDIMLKIGADRKYTTRYMLLCVLPVILLAAVSACIVGCVIHVPLMAVIEKWYAMSRPIYSNMVADAQGMLTGNMEALPLPIGTGTAGLLSCLMTCLLVFSCREWRKG